MSKEDPKFLIARPITDGYAKFDVHTRDTFLKAIESGSGSPTAAIRLLKLSPTTVKRWIRCGKMDRDEWTHFTGKDGWLNHSDEYQEQRDFYIALRSAEAKRDARVEMVLAENAMSDWRAADALGKRQERMDLHEDVKRLKKAQADAAQHHAIAAQHEARFSKARADAAEKGEASIAGAVVFPGAFLDLCAPDVKAKVVAEMERLGYAQATDEELVAAASKLNEEDLDEIEAMAKKFKGDSPSLH